VFGDVREERTDFVDGEDDGQALRIFRSDGVDVWQLDFQDFLIEEEQGGEGLVLGAGGDVFFDGEVGKESFDVWGTEG